MRRPAVLGSHTSHLFTVDRRWDDDVREVGCLPVHPCKATAVELWPQVRQLKLPGPEPHDAGRHAEESNQARPRQKEAWAID